MRSPIPSWRRTLLFTGALALMTAAPGRTAPPPGTYPAGLYPTYAYPYYPAYRPSTYSPGLMAPGYHPYYGSYASSGYPPASGATLAGSYAPNAPAGGQTQNPSRFYIPSADEALPTVAHLQVTLPPDATLWINGWKAHSTGPLRKLQSPPLKPGQRYQYTIRARWQERGTEVTQTQEVPVASGADVVVRFPVPSGNGAKAADPSKR